jgi:CheY-like chemotaxis protein
LPGDGLHVLYIDDEQAIVIMVKELLERKGYCVSGYTDQNEALAAARAEPGRFDLVVTDYNMPGMSGLEVARALREIRADLPILMASGNITQEIRVEAPEAGVNELIFKPYTIEKLLQAIDRQTQAQRRNRKAG